MCSVAASHCALTVIVTALISKELNAMCEVEIIDYRHLFMITISPPPYLPDAVGIIDTNVGSARFFSTSHDFLCSSVITHRYSMNRED